MATNETSDMQMQRQWNARPEQISDGAGVVAMDAGRENRAGRTGNRVTGRDKMERDTGIIGRNSGQAQT